MINRYPDRPLTYNVAWKTTIYLLVSVFIHYPERLFCFSRQAGALVAGKDRDVRMRLSFPNHRSPVSGKGAGTTAPKNFSLMAAAISPCVQRDLEWRRC